MRMEWPCKELGKSDTGRGNSRCKGPEAGGSCCLGRQEKGQYDCTPVNKGDRDIKGGGGGSRGGEEIFVA